MLVSEASSNTASANRVIPAMMALAQTAGVNPLPPAIGATYCPAARMVRPTNLA
jgi:solute carrier family 13 (sodium-dependent dicarboxylate transporter), member 2/3/5